MGARWWWGSEQGAACGGVVPAAKQWRAEEMVVMAFRGLEEEPSGVAASVSTALLMPRVTRGLRSDLPECWSCSDCGCPVRPDGTALQCLSSGSCLSARVWSKCDWSERAEAAAAFGAGSCACVCVCVRPLPEVRLQRRPPSSSP